MAGEVRDSRGLLIGIDGVGIHHHPDNQPSPHLDALMRAAVTAVQALPPRQPRFRLGFERWLGIPWVMNGETMRGADCWGLVRLVYAQELGIDLKHASESTTARARESAERLRTVKELILGNVRFRPVADLPPQDLDVVEIALEGGALADHVAIVAGGMLLHSLRNIGSHRADIARYEDKIRGVWRLV